MAGKAETLQKQMGGNIRASIGAGGSAPRLAPPRREVSKREIGTTRAMDTFDIRLDRLIADPDQPRKEFTEEAIERTAASLRKQGQLMPIRVRWSEAQGLWVVLDGERRLRAARLAGIIELKAVEDKSTDTADIRLKQLTANLMREDLKPIEEANAFAEILELTGWTTTQLAAEANLSQGHVSQRLALRKLAPELQARVEEGTLSPTTAYEVSTVKDPAEQARIVEQAEAEDLSRDDVRAIVKEAKAEAKAQAPSGGRKPRAAAAKTARPVSHWRQKVDGFSVEIERKKGFDWALAAQALRSAAAKIEADHQIPQY